MQKKLSSSTTTTTTDASGGGKTQTHKKQIRRRLQSSRPYQERLLNMAEARREIATALKQHRASTTRHTARIQPPPPPPLNHFSPPPPPDPVSWTTNPPLSFLLPNQPLGLNLNFHDFDNFIQTSSTSSIFPANQYTCSSSSPPPIFYPTPQPPFSAVDNKKQQQLMTESENNVVTSAWWSELMLKTVEQEIKPEEKDDVFPKLSDVMEYPLWLNTTDQEESFHPYNFTNNRHSSLHNPPLSSCMEIGEIEGIDGEDDWLP